MRGREHTSFLLFCLVGFFCLLSVTTGRIMNPGRHYHPMRRPTLTHKAVESQEVYKRVPSYDTYEFLSKQYGFICQDKASGYHGDPNYECRIFHVCHADGRRDTFFCPALTRFNNNLQICDWQHKVDQHCISLYHIHIPIENPFNHVKETYLLPPIQNHFRPDEISTAPYHNQIHYSPQDKVYRNKYQEQEYYQSLQGTQDTRIKFLLETQVPGPLYPSKQSLARYLPQPVFNNARQEAVQPEVNALLAHGTDFQLDSSPNVLDSHEDEQKVLEHELSTHSPGVEVEQDAEHQDEKSEDAAVIKYGPESQSVIQIPPAVNHNAILQTSSGGLSRTEGNSGAAVPTEAGGGHSAKMDSPSLSLLAKEYDDSPIIELWIPTRVKNLS